MSTDVDVAYVESYAPGQDRLRPRAHFASDVPAVDLDGTWRFRLAPGLGDLTADFHEPGFADSTWDELPVPSLWQLHGYGTPAYLNINYPFPIDPPRVPTPTRPASTAASSSSPRTSRWSGRCCASRAWTPASPCGSTDYGSATARAAAYPPSSTPPGPSATAKT